LINIADRGVDRVR